ncbi:MAG: Zn-dependent hydrolase, glyoxylase family [Verrucomicrobiota bacterium]|jgi:glyoxylase-like metal-dependent hydrolase (beta-lactamase superfamily II)
MQLEDHVGDVLAKARKGLGLEVGELARLAGRSEGDYAGVEDSGDVSGLDLAPLAQRLGLDGGKLSRVAGGWVPAVPDLGVWRELRVVTTERGMSVNAYLIWDEVTREAALFDTGWDAEPLVALIGENDLELRHIFITHSHGDHVAALAEVRAKYPKARLHSSSPDVAVHERNRANDFIHLGSLRITNRATPGHTADGVTYVVGTWPEDAPNVAIVGDALFAGSMGGAGAQLGQARESVVGQIFTLPADTLVCPGHGPLTTVGEERSNNPFFV